jgi:hypothetical protein
MTEKNPVAEEKSEAILVVLNCAQTKCFVPLFTQTKPVAFAEQCSLVIVGCQFALQLFAYA